MYELLDLLKTQQDTINKQNKMITELINENTEKENYICVLSKILSRTRIRMCNTKITNQGTRKGAFLMEKERKKIMDFKDLLNPTDEVDFDEKLYQKNLEENDWSKGQEVEKGEDHADNEA